jgi:carboxypeptidase D
MLDALTWRGETGFGLNITAKDWYVNGTLAGTWKEARNLTWVVVKDAGHMVRILACFLICSKTTNDCICY